MYLLFTKELYYTDLPIDTLMFNFTDQIYQCKGYIFLPVLFIMELIVENI